MNRQEQDAKEKRKQPTDAFDRNKMDLEKNSTKLECSYCAVKMCVRVGVFLCLRDLSFPTSPQGRMDCYDVTLKVPEWFPLPYTRFIFSTLNHSARCEKLLISRHSRLGCGSVWVTGPVIHFSLGCFQKCLGISSHLTNGKHIGRVIIILGLTK